MHFGVTLGKIKQNFKLRLTVKFSSCAPLIKIIISDNKSNVVDYGVVILVKDL